MNPNHYSLKEFNPKIASDAEIEAVWHFNNTMANESSPNEATPSLEFFKNALKNQSSFVTNYAWNLYDNQEQSDIGKIAARVGASIYKVEENQHIVNGGVDVLADYRKQGMAKFLLPKLLEVAKRHNRRLIMFDTISSLPSGEFFAKRIGAKAGLPLQTIQLELKNLDTDLMTEWSNRFNEISNEFELVLWQDDIPEKEIAAFCKLTDVMNTAPTDDLDVEDEKLTPEMVKENLAHAKDEGEKFWMMLAKHKENNEFAGYTDLTFYPENEKRLYQGDTGILPKYRGHGLGKILKAKNLIAAMENVPTVEIVRTTNANSNDAMLKINTEMGFKPYKTAIVWELETDALEAYLKS